MHEYIYIYTYIIVTIGGQAVTQLVLFLEQVDKKNCCVATYIYERVATASGPRVSKSRRSLGLSV